MIKVAIKNLRNSKPKHPWQVRVDRASILGNPYHMVDESQRDKVCNQYEEYFNENMKYPDTAFYNEIERLYGIMKEYGKLELYCWCAPKRCHAETSKAYLEARQPVYSLWMAAVASSASVIWKPPSPLKLKTGQPVSLPNAAPMAAGKPKPIVPAPPLECSWRG